MQIELFISPFGEIDYTSAATLDVEGVLYQRGERWRNPLYFDQHGAECAWMLDERNAINVSKLATLRIDSDRYSIVGWNYKSHSIFLQEKEPSASRGDEILFPIGRLVATPGAGEALVRAKQDPMLFVLCHQSGDWGDVCEEDQQLNSASVTDGTRILSAYKTSLGEKLWVITEADRSATTILLPEEY